MYNVATCLTCHVICYGGFIAKFLENVTVKEFLNSVNT